MNDLTERPESKKRRTQFSIRTLMIWTAIIAGGAAIVGTIQRFDFLTNSDLGPVRLLLGILSSGLALAAYSILVSGFFTHMRYRWHNTYVNFATAMNALCPFVLLMLSKDSDAIALAIAASLTGLGFFLTLLYHSRSPNMSSLVCFYTLATSLVWSFPLILWLLVFLPFLLFSWFQS